MVAPFQDAPGLVVHGPDGTPVAVFAGGAGPGTPVLLVHGTGSDHATWRVLAPLLAEGRRVYAMDRRGRGSSGDGPAYEASLEAGDVAVAAEAIAAAEGGGAAAEAIGPAASLADTAGRGIAVVGHSLGGRFGLAAALRTGAISTVIAYEAAPPVRDPHGGGGERLLAALRADLAAGDDDAVLERFLREAAGLPEHELAAFRGSALWPVRAATAPQVVRELDAALHDPAIALDALARVEVPVLQLAGTASPAGFREGVLALDQWLARGSVEFVAGARHNAHHSHAEAFAASVIGYLGD
jgi:pimeloyl-ACP methyl ester carboxylesterase